MSSPILGWAPGWQEIVLILLVILLLFGGKKLPELARSVARGMREFKDELKGVKKDLDEPEPNNGEQNSDQANSSQSPPRDDSQSGGDKTDDTPGG